MCLSTVVYSDPINLPEGRSNGSVKILWMLCSILKREILDTVYEECAYSLHSYCLTINLFEKFPSYFKRIHSHVVGKV
jgi:hypothetical protein